MDWLARLFNPQNYTVTLLLTVLVLSAGLALFRRRMEWSGAAVLAAFIGSTAFSVLAVFLNGIGPLFVLGWGLQFVYGVLIALPTVGAIRGVRALMVRET